METNKISDLLIKIYGKDKGENILKRLIPVMEEYKKKINSGQSENQEYFTEKDSFLITYGNTIVNDNEKPLKTLKKFLNKYVKDNISIVHILPFSPYSSDDGFSVIDYYKVNPELGDWEEINELKQDYKLMFDLVLNHISAKSEWFQKYLKEDGEFKNLAIEIEPGTDLSKVVRPRSLPLLTKFKKQSGKQVLVWTTFSEDQIDLNYKDENILLNMIKVLLFYVQNGAKVIRMDAIAYLWKELGTSCIHLEKTHLMVKLFRAIFDIVCPNVIILTETNVPHKENISYFGNGKDEAQMVYNFTLPPLTLYTFMFQDSGILSNWAKTLKTDSKYNTFLNFTSSHDGIGVRPLEGIVDKDKIDIMVKKVIENGGKVSTKKNSDGTDSPYELNITYIDALKNKDDNVDLIAKKFLASQFIELSLPGVPAVYIHNLIGTTNWYEGVEQTKRARTINRRIVNYNEIITEINDKNSLRNKIFYPLLNLLSIRKQYSVFHPNADFEIMDIDNKIFCIKRSNLDSIIYAVVNISNKEVGINKKIFEDLKNNINIITKENINNDNIILTPYEFMWIN